MGSSAPPGSPFLADGPEKPFVASMGVYLFSRDVLLETLARQCRRGFRPRDHPRRHPDACGQRLSVPRVLGRRGTIASFYDTNIMLTHPHAPFNFYDPQRPVHASRFLPGSRLNACTINEAIVAEGCYLDHATIEHSVVGIRTHIYHGSRISRSVLLGADFYEADEDAPARGDDPALGIGEMSCSTASSSTRNARIGDGVRLTNADGSSTPTARGITSQWHHHRAAGRDHPARYDRLDTPSRGSTRRCQTAAAAARGAAG